ncbi:hypothetical protein BH10PSE12_BH10PSE12_00080 [soil metagenome]
MKFICALAIPALTIAAAATAQAVQAPYRAAGSAPEWTLRIDHGLIAFAAPRDRVRVVAPAPVARPSFNGLRYVTPRITVDVTYARCIDTRTGDSFHDRVTVTVGRKNFSGCGGEKLAPTLALSGTRWMIAAIDGRPVRTSRTSDISFTDTRIAGNAGCNSFGGAYRLTGDRLSTGQVMSTRMACAGPGKDVEGKFFAAIASAQIKRSGSDTMTLSGDNGTIELRAVR